MKHFLVSALLIITTGTTDAADCAALLDARAKPRLALFTTAFHQKVPDDATLKVKTNDGKEHFLTARLIGASAVLSNLVGDMSGIGDIAGGYTPIPLKECSAKVLPHLKALSEIESAKDRKSYLIELDPIELLEILHANEHLDFSGLTLAKDGQSILAKKLLKLETIPKEFERSLETSNPVFHTLLNVLSDRLPFKHTKTLKGHKNSVSCIAYSPDGTQLASSSLGYTVKIWDLANNSCKYTLEHDNPIYCVAYSPNGQQLASGLYRGSIVTWNPRRGTYEHILRGHERSVHDLSYSPDGQQLASGSIDGTVRLWDVTKNTCQHVLRVNTWIHGLSYSPDGKQIAAGSLPGSAEVWNVADGTHQCALENDRALPLDPLAYNPKSWRLIALGNGDGTITIWNPAEKTYLTLKDSENVLSCAAYSPDGDKLASGSYDNAVRILDPTDGTCLQTLKDHNYYINCVTFSPNGKQIASCSYDDTIKLWDQKYFKYDSEKSNAENLAALLGMIREIKK